MSLAIPMSLAAIIASAGLLSNSSSSLIASMIISPLLSPISKIIKGKVQGSYKQFRNVLIMIIAALLCGFVVGMLNTTIGTHFPDETESMKNMVDLGDKNRVLLTEYIIAMCVGFGIPFAVKYNLNSLLIAFAIAPSITPPLVNCGMYLANYVYKLINIADTKNKIRKAKKQYKKDNKQEDLFKITNFENKIKLLKETATDYLKKSGKALSLSSIHIITITIVSLTVYKFLFNFL